MTLNKILGRGLAALGLLALGGCATAPAVPDTAHPALWRVSDPDTSIYLFGTFHLLPEGYVWQTPAIRTAVDQSSELIVETILDEQHPQALAAAIGRIGFAQGLPPLAERIAPALRPKLAAAIKASALPAPYLDRMKTWTAAFMLVGSQFKALGLKGDAGVEPNLRRSFEGAGKHVGELETNGQQLSFFDGLSEPAQRAFLEGTISDPDKMHSEFAAMLKSWSVGDVEGIARSFNADLQDSPELRAALLTRRNVNWTQWVERRLQQPGTLMVAVGAGHLAGDNSVISLLKQQGYKVERIE